MDATLLIERLRVVLSIRPIGAEVAPVFGRREEAFYPNLPGLSFGSSYSRSAGFRNETATSSLGILISLDGVIQNWI